MRKKVTIMTLWDAFFLWDLKTILSKDYLTCLMEENNVEKSLNKSQNVDIKHKKEWVVKLKK